MMNEVSQAPVSTAMREPIPGYVLRDKLGSGGCGEVWKADAPGGIAKAVKIVYGHVDEPRAINERKSLNRMKDVRHPFLLSIERIEVVSGHLVVVTELAESSVKDRFQQCQQLGLAGIPRAELLGYLRDTADALDFLFESFSFQHLDVKPENLLLVGNRVKVADFGLVTEVNSSASALTGGLTPLYAAPEVFDGRPTRYSDQYSLAIVFQEMLTGQAPFNGRTAAQLAAQHLQTQPVLTHLPPNDRHIVARALSKNPEERFSSCGEFVRALTTAGQASKSFSPAASTNFTATPNTNAGLPGGFEPQGTPASFTSTDDVMQNASHTISLSEDYLREISSQRTQNGVIVELPPLEASLEECHFRPTLVIGIGGAAGKVLLKYRRRLLDRYKDADAIKSWQMLYIDTDVKVIRDLVQTKGEVGLRDQDVLATPLRRPEEYRGSSPQLLRWMSRRWLYNIPRSLQTEGIRPLGRLAMVDHFDRIQMRLQDVLNIATDPQSLIDSERAANRHFFPVTPRVVIVAAISGGTGGGMVFDIAAAVRHSLKQMNFPDAEIVGLLLHATERRVGTRGLALANSHASLQELNHYQRATGGYPGDPACKLPALDPGRGLFDESYVLHLGDDLNDQEFATSTDSVAEYLYLDTATPVSGFLQQCRDATVTKPSLTGASEVYVRSFGLRQMGGSNSQVPTAVAELLSHQLLQTWRGSQSPVVEEAQVSLTDVKALLAVHGATEAAPAPQFEHLAEAQLAPFKLEKLLEQAYNILQGELGGNVESFLTHMLRETQVRVAVKHRDSPHLLSSRTLETIDAILGAQASEEESDSGSAISLASMLSGKLVEIGQTQGDALQKWSFQYADQNAMRIKGAQRFIDWCLEELRKIEKDSAEHGQQFRTHLTELRQILCEQERLEASGAGSSRGGRGRVPSESVWLDYVRTRIHLVTLRSVARQLRIVQGKLTYASDKPRDLWKDLHQIEREFATQLSGAVQDDPLAEALWRERLDLVAKIDQELALTMGPETERIRHFIALQQGLRTLLVPQLRAAARRVALRALKQLNLNESGTTDPASEQSEDSLERDLAAAQPRILNCGGSQRLVMILPEGADVETLQARLAVAAPTVQASIVFDADGDIVLCREAEQLPLAKAAELLVAGHEQASKAASQLHTRTDVEWTSF